MPETPEARKQRLKDLAEFQAADDRAKAQEAQKAAAQKARPAAKPAAQPAAKPAEKRVDPAVKQVVRQSLRELLEDRAEMLDDPEAALSALEAVNAGVKDANSRPREE